MLDNYVTVEDFNPRPREEGDGITAKRLYQRCNFNPRPREEGDFVLYAVKATIPISIHALVKRATQGILFLLFGLAEFQSTPS